MSGFRLAVARIGTLLLTCVVVFGIGFWFLLQGQEMDNVRQERRWHRLQNQATEGKAAFKARPLFREEVTRLEQEADRWLSSAPPGGGISEMLRHLGRIGTGSGVTLQQYPSGESTRVTVRGSRPQMLAFFAALHEDRYPFVADDFELFVEDATGLLQADFAVDPAGRR